MAKVKVVTPEQLTTVANAQKAYIDRKDEKVSSDVQTKLDALELPEAATDAEIDAIKGIFPASDGDDNA